jgi:iron complex transport system ATP-binding protein
MSALAIERVTVRRGARAVLDAVDASFAAGRLTAVIGPNGAGKSTLLEVAAGLLSPAAGVVRLGDRPLAAIPRRELAMRRAYLPQGATVDWAIAVERVVALGLTAHVPAFGGLPRAWRPRIAAALERHDLLALRDRPATQLSGGELARVMLARATVGEPELLIVDEPTAGLDPRHAFDAGARLRALADAGCTVVVALHDLDLALRIADDVLALKHGRVVAHGAAGDVFTDATLSALYDVAVRVTRDEAGAAIRFLGQSAAPPSL